MGKMSQLELRGFSAALADEIEAMVRSCVDSALVAVTREMDAIKAREPVTIEGPRGLPGEQGERGLPGADGAPGRDGERGLQGLPGEPGERGERGLPGERGEKGMDGAPGLPGRDGRDGMPGKDGERGMDGAPGRDGVDGLGFDDMTVTSDGERTVLFKFQRGELVKEFAMRFPIPIYRGVFKSENKYEEADLVTNGGSVWMALKADPGGRPDEGNADWRLIVKRGRDGKDGKDGARGERGLPGERGRDLTALGPDGSRYR